MLDQNIKKALLLIMRCSIIAIECSSYIIPINFDSLVGVNIKCLLLLSEINLTGFAFNNNIYKFIQVK